MANRLLVVLDVQRGAHLRNLQIFLFKCGDVGLVHQSQPDIVEPLKKAFAAERIDREGISQTLVIGDDLFDQINGHAIARVQSGALEQLVNLFV